MEHFFDGFEPPNRFEETCDTVTCFIKHQLDSKRQIVLVTSGGTAVPMESRTVRFIDNFSTGTRGAASTEYFLAKGYAVIFLYRKKSAQPFVRHFPDDSLLDLFTLESETESTSNQIKVNPCHAAKLCHILHAQSKARDSRRLFSIPFFSLQDYLYHLRAISQQLTALEPSIQEPSIQEPSIQEPCVQEPCVLGSCDQGSNAMLFLAAAVSDFYIPHEALPEHKLQSSEGPPVVKLSSVPKMLPVIVHQWVPKAFVVSFKLETDRTLLLAKARKALETNQHQVVVANLLNERRHKVTVVTPDSETDLTLSNEQATSGKELEELLVEDLVSRHRRIIQERVRTS